jgi:hypothetical protein
MTQKRRSSERGKTSTSSRLASLRKKLVAAHFERFRLFAPPVCAARLSRGSATTALVSRWRAGFIDPSERELRNGDAQRRVTASDERGADGGEHRAESRGVARASPSAAPCTMRR